MTDPMLDLLDEAVTILRTRLADSLSGEQRYLALLTANAVATARREAQIRERLEEVRKRIDVPAADIRNGRHDGDGALYDRLREHVILRAWIADPATLSDEERAIVGGIVSGP